LGVARRPRTRRGRVRFFCRVLATVLRNVIAPVQPWCASAGNVGRRRAARAYRAHNRVRLQRSIEGGWLARQAKSRDIGQQVDGERPQNADAEAAANRRRHRACGRQCFDPENGTGCSSERPAVLTSKNSSEENRAYSSTPQMPTRAPPHVRRARSRGTPINRPPKKCRAA